jgi:hypothetical protein
MALASMTLEKPQGTPYRASLRDYTYAQGPKFSLRGKNKFGPIEVGANYPHDDILREFKGLIVLRTYLSHAKGASPRSYFSFTKAAGAFNNYVCHFMRELDWTGCVRLSTTA